MTEIQIGIAGFILLGVLIYLGVQISTALLAVAFAGLWAIKGDIAIAGNMLAIAATDSITEYEFGTVPLFVLMGFLVMVAGVGEDSYAVAHRLLRKVPGGLGHATVIGNAIFSAITGVTVAAVVLFTRVAVPEMLARGYNARLAVGIVAGSAMLGMLIPPSVLMIIYAVLTEVSIGDMYNAGIVPGIILTGAFSIAIWLIAVFRPQWVGRPAVEVPRESRDRPDVEQRSLAAMAAPIMVLIGLVLGGMYSGLFTATEAGAVGAMGGLVIAAWRRALTPKSLWSVLMDTGYVTASLILIIASASMFSRFLALSGVPAALGNWVQTMGFGLYTVLVVYTVVILMLGTALDSTSTVLISVPIFAPIFLGLGADLVRIGVITMIAVEVGLITPPLGMSPFIVKASLSGLSLDKRISLNDIYFGAMPFAVTALAVVALLIWMPEISRLLGR